MTVLVLVETVLLAVLTVLVAGLLRAYGTVLRRLHALDPGTRQDSRPFEVLPTPTARPAGEAEFGPAHDVTGETLRGEIVSARVVGVEHNTLLLFLSSGCATCEAFWTDLGKPGAIQLPAGTRLLVVAQGAEDESRADLAAMAPDGVDVILSSRAWRDYEVPGSPHVVYVDGATGQIRGEGTGQSLRQVAELLARATGDVGFLTGAPARKSARDREQEVSVDRELLAAGILPGDPRLYGSDER
jgi:hypothetical protein